MYEGSGPLESDRASSLADFDSSASRHGNAIAGFEASARLAAEAFCGREAWYCLFASFRTPDDTLWVVVLALTKVRAYRDCDWEACFATLSKALLVFIVTIRVSNMFLLCEKSLQTRKRMQLHKEFY